MVSSFGDVVRYAETHQVNNRIAAYMLAIDRVGLHDSPARNLRLGLEEAQSGKGHVP